MPIKWNDKIEEAKEFFANKFGDLPEDIKNHTALDCYLLAYCIPIKEFSAMESETTLQKIGTLFLKGIKTLFTSTLNIFIYRSNKHEQ